MGLIELHFHESEFDFSPSMVTGAADEAALETDEESDEAADEDVESAGWKTEETEPSSSAGLGALVALAVLVVLGLLVGWKRRSGGDEADVELEA